MDRKPYSDSEKGKFRDALDAKWGGSPPRQARRALERALEEGKEIFFQRHALGSRKTRRAVGSKRFVYDANRREHGDGFLHFTKGFRPLTKFERMQKEGKI